MRFAHLKTYHRFERMRLRGLSGARDDFHLAAIVQNLKTLANHIWRPPPDATNAATASLSSSSCHPLKEGIAKTPSKAPGTRPSPLVADFFNSIDPLRTFCPGVLDGVV